MENNKILNQVKICIDKLDYKKEELAMLDGQVKEKKEEIRMLVEEHIPNIMREAGITALKLEDGRKVSIGEEVFASILNADRGKIFQWLEDHNFSGLIKTQVIFPFSRGDKEKALEFMERNIDLQPELKEDVHAQTLKAFIKEQLAAGEDFPLDLFGARCVTTTKIRK